MLPQQRMLASVFLMLPALAAVAMSLGARHAVIEVWRQYLLSPSGQVPMTLLCFLKKLHQLLVSSFLGIVEVLSTSLTAL
jgi:hypothetical protein